MSRITVDGLRAYVTEPKHKTAGGVLVLPTIAGVDEHQEHVCHQLNEAGLLALVWDPFSAYDPEMPLKERLPIGKDKLEDAPCQREQRQWLSYMQEQLGCDSLGVIGFCLGGRMAFTLCAADQRLKACVAYHPSLSHPAPPHHLDAVGLAPEVRCPVQLIYPGQDHVTTRGTFDALREALESRQEPTTVHVYPTAGHGFLEPNDPWTGNPRQNPGNAEATRLSWPQAEAFLRACLL
jgi:carboxymethylenebutenolidase